MAPHRGSVSQPHSVSLKVLRLSRPSLAQTNPLPPSPAELHRASLAHPGQASDAFPLTPLLTLPPSFGAAYVGETFSCTLCANNERHVEDPVGISGLIVTAELQTPSVPAGISLPLTYATDERAEVLAPATTAQGLVSHELTEEGGHVLAVSVSYTELHGEEEKHRSFRKLYQFVARQAIGVRTKIGTLGGGRCAVEAQIENLTQGCVVMEQIALEPAEGVRWLGLNEGGVLGEGDVQQVAFVVEGEGRVDGTKMLLARLRVDWRMGMGQEGTLRTGWLGAVRTT